PVVIRPNSLVRINPETLKPTWDVSIGKKADLVVAKGGYVWVNHWSLRYQNDVGVHNGGDRKLTRVTVSTGRVEDVGGGLAPCGLAPDPSGDVWVANCYTAGLGGPVTGNVVRVHARTKEFDPPVKLPTADGYYRGMVFGGGSLWLAGVAGGKHKHPEDLQLLRWNPETRKLHTIRLQRAATALAWSPVSNDLWMSNCGNGSVSRMHLATKKVTTPFEDVSNAPCPVAVGIDGAIWVGDWDASPPRVIR